jgi:hypothetical protein
MNELMLAAVNFGAFGLIQWLIVAIVVAGVIGITLVVFRQSGIAIPGFVIQICWIVLCVVIGVIAIKLLASLL